MGKTPPPVINDRLTTTPDAQKPDQTTKASDRDSSIKDPHSSLQVRLIFQTSGWGQFPTLDSRIRSYDILFPSPGTYTIINREISLSYEGVPGRHTHVCGFQTHPPREWTLYEAAEPRSYHVVVPGPLVDGGKKLAFDRSPLLIIPPFTELTYLDREDQKQAWTFNIIVF
ncbi:hypothetical protein BJV77DRAFT_1019209 [Russula vinacea]|nr:hypothetical protein BJV77DRAFT_1019209 [Russula vinacea]